MLRTSRVWVALCALLAATSELRAQEDDAGDALRRPERLTLGINDQFLGQLSPDEKTLFFASTRDIRKEIFAQNLEDSRPQRVFDEDADVTWPRVSPDGKALLYISFRDHVSGALCVRNLPDGTERRCLASRAAALQAEWIDSRRIVLVSRASIEADLQVSEVAVGEQLSQRVLFNRNEAAPTVSPNGRWLVSVPLDRTAKRVGPGFAARAAGHLHAVRLDRPNAPTVVQLDLPGLVSQPAFSKDGQSLYFVQFFADSNHDGLIDASDNGALFRVAFPSEAEDAPARAALAVPAQLTDSGRNCQYPSPALTRLVVTCARRDDLDIFQLPLDGQVPHEWTSDRLRDELAVTERRPAQLLLYRRWFEQEPSPAVRRLTLMSLVMLHLELEEFQAADFYAKKLVGLRDPATRGLRQPLAALVAHRQAQSAEERGRQVGSLAQQAAEALQSLEDGEKDSPAARVLNRVVRSEIADASGNKAMARKELESVVLDASTPGPVIEAYFARADALYRQLDDRDALVAVCRALATRPGAEAEDRLEFARAAVAAMVRGKNLDEADALLARARASEPADSELAFAIDLMRLTLSVREGQRVREIRPRFVALYEAQQRPDRRRAIVLEGVQRAAETGADPLIEALSEQYLDDVQKGTIEARRAERLYKRTILGRAYRRLARGRVAEARADFEVVFRRTAALDAAIGAIDLRLAAGESEHSVETDLLKGLPPASAVRAFVRAYLLARELPRLSEDRFGEVAEQARELLRSAWPELKNSAAARALNGAIAHEQYVRTGESAAAERANFHYLIALELTRQDTRYRAMLLGQLGLLHSQAGNYRIALGHLAERAKLPFNDDAEALAGRLALARALLHVDREVEAAMAAEQALALTERAPALARFRVLALDRAALYNLAAERFPRALALYDAELPLLSRDGTPAARRNRFVVRVAHAAAALGAGQPQRSLEDLRITDAELPQAGMVTALTAPPMSEEQTERSFRVIASGLRANAELALGRPRAAARALAQQRTLLLERLKSSERDEDLRAVTLVELRLAAAAKAQPDLPAAVKWLGMALDRADAFALKTRVPVDRDQLHALWLAADLKVFGSAQVPFDVPRRLAAAQQQLSQQRESTHRLQQRWFEIYLTLLHAEVPEPLKPPAKPALAAKP